MDVLFSTKEVDNSLVANHGMLACVPRLVGNMSLLYELTLEGHMFSTEEASWLGLMSYIVDRLHEEVISTTIAFAKVMTLRGRDALL